LLKSPHHGERWARHWLDLARWAESHGFEHDYDRPTAYHYRDFVIEAFNVATVAPFGAQGLAVEDTARLFVRAACGIMGTIDLSWSINKELDWYVTVYGTHGVVQVGWKLSRYKKLGGDWTVFGHGYDKVQAFRSQVNNFAAAIRGQEPLVITWEDAVASVEVITAAYQSLRAAPWTGVSQDSPLTSTPRPISQTDSIREVTRV